MSQTCTARGCTALAAGYSQYCSGHKNRQRRHGHPDQTPVTKAELLPYLKELTARRKKDAASPAWAILDGRWQAIVRVAVETCAAYEGGQVSQMEQVEAARIVRDVAGSASSLAAIDTALAVCMLRQRRPGRFHGEALRHQLVKRVAALGPRSAGRSWDQKRQSVRLTYKDIPPRVVLILSEQLLGAFWRAGVQLAELPLKEAEKRREENQRLDDAIAAMGSVSEKAT